MKEYQFQYTRMWDTIAVILLAIATFVLGEFLGLHLKLNIILTIVFSFGLAFLIFQFLKRKIVRSCTAKLNENFVEFDFTEKTKVINFSDLISFKEYYGKNGPILYLKTQTENFTISANNNYCKTENFKIFSDDTITQLEKYKTRDNSTLIHEGSIYTTTGYLYFLIIASIIYLIAVVILSKELRPYIGIGGGFYLFIMWTLYFVKRNLKSE